jgi:hypothetical protein
VARAQEMVAEVLRTGRAGESQGGVGNGPSPAATHPDDVALRVIMDRYDRLGSDPPRFTIAANDAAHRDRGAHTEERHGPDVPLPRDPNARTTEGRIYGDPPWSYPENWSYRWTDPSTMNRTVNEYVRRHWEDIRSDLALRGRHSGGFDAGHRVGEGYFNTGMYGAGPRNSQYTATSLVVVRIRLVPGSDPPEPFVLTAFPAGLL